MKIRATFFATLLASFVLAACAGSSKPVEPIPAAGTNTEAKEEVAESVKRIHLIGTNDLHGHIEMLPIFSGYLQNLRASGEGEILLLDGGDMFQGTLASNMVEGKSIVEAYNKLGYDAVTIGNHEFDFGPVGPDATASKDGQDPRGALKARASEAEYPFLSANIIDDTLQTPVRWPNVFPSVIREKSGVSIGIIGLSTFETPQVTLPANFVGLRMAPLAEAVAKEAKILRDKGAELVIVTAHAGGHCKHFDEPTDLSSCREGEEIFEVAEALPANTVDAIVGGHTHRGVAHFVNGIAIIESFSRGTAFGRVDLVVDEKGARVERIFPPRNLCLDGKAKAGCDAGEYAGKAVQADSELKKIAASAEAVAEEIRSEKLGVEAVASIGASRGEASVLGNLFTDLMLAAQPKADFAITNGGSLRAELPAGPLLYGSLFEAMPFDNRFAIIKMKAKDVKKVFAKNLQRENGLLSVSGLWVEAQCKKGKLEVGLRRKSGKRIRDTEVLTMVTSDFLASGGDGLLGEGVIKSEIDQGPLIRDAMAEVLRKAGGKIDPTDKALFNPKKPRVKYTGERPLVCE